MKKDIFKYLCAIVLIIIPMALFTACSDDDGSSGISGYYSDEPSIGWDGYTFRSVYFFKNSNTVIKYDYVANGRYWNDSSPFPEHTGWYYDGGGGQTFTYTIHGNKIYITNGTIMTIENGGERLVPDGYGSHWTYTRW